MPQSKKRLLVSLLALACILGALGLRFINVKPEGVSGLHAPSGLPGPSAVQPVQSSRKDLDVIEMPQPDGLRGSPAAPTDTLLSDPVDQPSAEGTSQLLTNYANEALFGRVYIDSVLATALDLASLPISTRPDFDYEDDDAIAYRFEGLPSGVSGHMLIGMQPYNENGHTYRYVQMQLDIAIPEAEYLDGAMRDGPNINFSISYDVESPNKPTRFALMLQRRVDLHASRNTGMDAYSGVFTQGAYYWQDLLRPETPPSASTIGIVDGNPVFANAFPNAIPLFGDLSLDLDLLNAVLAKLHEQISTVKGE